MRAVVIGGGVAGLSAALNLAPMPVTLISANPLEHDCSSMLAQGGLAAAVGEGDNPIFHAQDTISAGCGLVDIKIAHQVAREAPSVIDMLCRLGARFDRQDNGLLSLGLEAAHSKRRIVRAKDATGKVTTQTLAQAVRASKSITVLENAIATSLLSDGRIYGVAVRIKDRIEFLPANAVVLATGGAAALWKDTTNPLCNWGSGLALAARAGATLADLEFVQFHPTAIDVGGDPMPLASEALRGEGCKLIDENGERFIDELRPRDEVARAIWNKTANGKKVYLDARRALGKGFSKRFPNVYQLCMSNGINPEIDTIPVKPAAHYHMGGIFTDENGRSDVDGLWACGEVACTGLHGANRLASNSLVEAISFGARCAKDIKSRILSNKAKPALSGELSSAVSEQDANFIRSVMSRDIGVVRNRIGLEAAIEKLSSISDKSDMAFVASMIAKSALRRDVSCGSHFREDCALSMCNKSKAQQAA